MRRTNLGKKLNNTREHKIPGKLYNMTTEQKAAQLQLSVAFLNADQRKEKPTIDFARY